MRDQRVHQRRELPVHHFAELVQRQADAVVANAILREV